MLNSKNKKEVKMNAKKFYSENEKIINFIIQLISLIGTFVIPFII